MLKRVISGGQTGVDQAALYAAKSCGLQTGGMMPHDFRTLFGRWRHAQCFNMTEHEQRDYPTRTRWNVNHSDGTLRIAFDFDTAGELCTLKSIKHKNKPNLDIELDWNWNPSQPPNDVVDWIVRNKISTLNVAGNSESTRPGIGMAAAAFLTRVFLVFAS